MAQRVAESLNRTLASLRGQISGITEAVDALAGCDLRVQLEDGADGEIGRLRAPLGRFSHRLPDRVIPRANVQVAGARRR